MADWRATWRAVNTERDKNALPSGTSDIALNVVIDGTELMGRQGFGAWNTWLSDNSKTVLNAAIVTFANGATYVVVKLTDGFLWFTLVDSDPSNNTFTKITDKFGGHNTSDRGWFYFWADRLFYSDRVGVTKWYGPTPSVWKAGLPIGATPAVDTSGGKGGKEGYYHVYSALFNTKTQEEGLISLPSAGTLTNLSEGDGGLQVDGTTWTAITVDTDYEFDEVRMYCTMGNTEFMPLGDGVEVFSHRVYLEYVDQLSFGSAPNLGKPDWAQDQRSRPENTGTQPPGSRTGYFNGGRAVYLDVYSGATALPGVINYSLPTIPTMIPTKLFIGFAGTYDDTTVFFPRPYDGITASGLGGGVTACGAVGDTFVAFTPTQTYWLVPSQSGALQPVIANDAQGCMSERGAVTIPGAVHALGSASWLRASKSGLQNIARYRFTDTLEEIPIAQRTKSVAAHYSHRNEVWMAVVKAGGTKAARILIWDESRGGLMTMFDPANLGDAGIVAMKELSTVDHEPQMLVFLDDGNILNYPDGTFLDGASTKYACEWQGYFAQEKRHQHQHLDNIQIHMGENNGDGDPDDNGITLEAVGLRTSGQDLSASGVTAISKIVTKQDEVDHSGVEFDPNQHGHLFRIKISSTADQGAAWRVADMILSVQKVI